MQAPKLDTGKLPSNARIVTHPNQCYDWGTFGWLLRSQEVNIKKYKYFVLLNSSVRGPYLPVYVPVRPQSPVISASASDTRMHACLSSPSN